VPDDSRVRTARLPDPVRPSGYRNAPEHGPRILFFSGGTALNGVSRVLKAYTHNSVHLVTPFDSGGSSAALRKAFNMPSIGDLRSRLIALADENVSGHPEVCRLFTYRLPKTGSSGKLLEQLDSMVRGKAGLVADIPGPMRRLIRKQLGYFRDAMPPAFNLQGASIGNLILAGGYLNNNEHLDPIISLFSELVNVLGTVRAVVNEDLHLVTELEDGSRLIGQHRLTGKEVAPLVSPVRKLYLSRSLHKVVPAIPELREKNRRLIREAQLICYPPGSFYSSLIANLLPVGVGPAIAASPCPKVYIPSLGTDPEQIGMSLLDTVQRLLEYLRAGNGNDSNNDRLLDFVLLDSRHGAYPASFPASLQDTGIQVIDTPLVSRQSAPYYDAGLLVSALLSLA
jgi:CofD-related protein of GAK system